MKILLVARSIYPDMSPRAFRVTELAKEFARVGHDVTVYAVTGDYNYSDFERQYNLTVKNLGPLHFKEITLTGNKLLLLFRRALRRILLLLFEYPDIELMFKAFGALKNESGYDLMVSFAVPHPIHWGSAKAVSKNRLLCKTWIADCGDPYMGNKLDSFRKPFYFKYMEKRFCRKAGYITITKEEMKGNYYSEFRDKIRIIPQGFCFEDVRIFQGKIRNEVPTFAYAGIFINKIRDPRPFLDYLATLKEDFKFIVYTRQPEFLAACIHTLKDKIEVRSYIPRLDLLYILSQMDFLINFEHNPYRTVPSKLIDYALTKRPILSMPSENFDSSHFNEFLKGDYRHQFIVEDIEQYNIRNVAKKFLSLHGGAEDN